MNAYKVTYYTYAEYGTWSTYKDVENNYTKIFSDKVSAEKYLIELKQKFPSDEYSGYHIKKIDIL